MKTRLPNFIVIGAPKSGTTSLYSYMKQHPEIYLPEKKELHYFSYEFLEKRSNGPGDKEILSRLCSSREEYERHYSKVKNEKAIGEFSPSYLYFSDASVKIMSELGRVKIVAILRDPVKKAFSQYLHLCREGRETLGFHEALMAEDGRMREGWLDIWYYAGSTLYADRIEKYMSVFGRENVKVTLFEDMVRSPGDYMKDMFSFLGVDDSFECDTSRAFNRSGIPRSAFISSITKEPNLLKSLLKKLVPGKLRTLLQERITEFNTRKKPEIDSLSSSYLKEYFQDDVKALERLTGLGTKWLNSN